MGDPGGIGAEVLVKALADRTLRQSARFHVFGLASAMTAAAERAGIEPFWWRVSAGSGLLDTAAVHDVLVIDHGRPDDPLHAARPTKVGGELSFRFVHEAIEASKRRDSDPLRASAIVTGPISKEAWAMAGHARFPGHTELLAARFGAKRHAMMFVTPRLRVVLATGHLPLMGVGDALTIGRVFDTIDLGADVCRRLGIDSPQVAVCGLNPHAGEAGLLGEEDSRIIAPAVRLAQEAGIDASGPFPGDTIFSAALAGRFHLVAAMYHDQGLIPVKLLDFDRAVNVTAGLPIIRTSPDHGTAFDIAGANAANAGSMTEALRLAVKVAAIAQS